MAKDQSITRNLAAAIDARQSAQSIAVTAIHLFRRLCGVILQDEIDSANWEESADLLSSIQSDVDRLNAYINTKLLQNESEN